MVQHERDGALDCDVLIVGAGLSGIGAACHLRRDCADLRLTILEARACSGGTWDLFRYPGIRSDSDMHTLGYDFKPWREAKAIADGPSILHYVRQTAEEYGIDRLIRYDHRVIRADFDRANAVWTVEVSNARDGSTRHLRSRFLFMCAGYYSYSQGYAPDFPGRKDFAGDFVHPQFWPEDLDYRDRQVVVIGSGATAMTLVPAMAQTAACVTMLQRSPTWVVSRPSRDWLARLLQAVLPDQLAYRLTRWRNTRLQQWFYRLTRRSPRLVARVLRWIVRLQVGKVVDVERDFTPRYDPWDQRVCVVPDGDLFAALRSGRARMETGEIARLTQTGVELASGKTLAADIIVSATGLQLNVLGDVVIAVDGVPVDVADCWTYKGVMFSGVPNLVSVFGYVNASWTLRADLIARFTARLLRHMDQHGLVSATPEVPEELAAMPARPWIADFSAGYLQRMTHRLPRQGDRAPWINAQDYQVDRRLFLQDPIDDGALVLRKAGATADSSSASAGGGVALVLNDTPVAPG